MHVLDIPRRFDGSFIEVPSFHRTHVGLFPGTKVHVCAFVDHDCGGASPPRPNEALSEIIVSPIDFQHWSRVWRFAGKFRERVGLVNDVFRVFNEHHVAVISAESSNWKEHPRRDGVHSLEALLILDPTIAPAAPTELTAAGLRARLEWALKACLFDDLILRADGTPHVSLRPVSALQDAARAFSRLSARSPAGSVEAIHSVGWIEGFAALGRDPDCGQAPDTPTGPAKIPQFVSRRAKLVLPADVKSRLLEALGAKREHNAGYYIRMSDTKDRVLRVLFSRHDQPIIGIRVLFDSTPRSLAVITQSLRDADFDIVSSFVSQSTVTPRAGLESPAAALRAHSPVEASSVFETILRYTSAPQRSAASRRNADSIKSRVIDALSSVTCAGLSIGLSFPKNYSVEWKLEWIESPKSGKRRAGSKADPVPTDRHRPYDRYMEAAWKYRALAVGGPTPGLEAPVPARVLLANALNDYYVRQGLGDCSNSRHTVFISAHFANPGLLNAVEQEAKQRLLRTVVARNMQAFENKRRGIIEQIRSCTFFFAVWDVDGALVCGDSVLPSPWLLWELGVAEAHGIPWRLLVSDRIEKGAYARLAMDRQHYVYELHDFDRRLKAALDEIVSDGVKPA
jgi:hypothetical protein